MKLKPTFEALIYALLLGIVLIVAVAGGFWTFIIVCALVVIGVAVFLLLAKVAESAWGFIRDNLKPFGLVLALLWAVFVVFSKLLGLF